MKYQFAGCEGWFGNGFVSIKISLQTSLVGIGEPEDKGGNGREPAETEYGDQAAHKLKQPEGRFGV